MRTLIILAGFCFAVTPLRGGDPSGSSQQRRAYEQHALTNKGDIERGRKLFAAETRTRCAVCHRVGDVGGRVGPDLSFIGGKFDRPHLIESLLQPSQQIVEGYRTTVLLMDSGQVISGIVKSETGDTLVIEDAEGKRRVINRSDIEQARTSNVSLMPDDLANALTPREFVDLIAYMESLRAGGKEKHGAGIKGPARLPDGYKIEVIATGLTGATALETLDDGRVLVCEQPGRLRVIKHDKLLQEPMLTVAVDRHWERGLIGVTVHPNFPHTPLVYVCYVAKDPHPHHRVSRFRIDGDTAVAGSEEILLRGDDQTKLGGNVPGGHQGGALHFDGDGKLYIAIGEQTAKHPAQKLDTFQGKILRICDDGSIPSDNPFYHEARGKYRAIWALGCRNPFTFAIDAISGQMLINDVGGKFEEINRGAAGANYGWPVIDHGLDHGARYNPPVHIYPQASIAGGDFAPREFGDAYQGHYFFADFVHGWIRTIDPEDPKEALPFANGLRRPVDLRFAIDGSLYLLLRNAWVIDGKFQGGTGSLLRLRR